MIRSIIGTIILILTFPWGYFFIDKLESWMLRVETVAYNCIERIKELEQELMRARLEAKKDKEWNQDTGKYYIEDLKEKIKEFEYVLGITKTKPKGKLFPKCPVWRFQ